MVGLFVACLMPFFAIGQSRSEGEATGTPALPRFVSLKSDLVNVRRGPGREYDVAWVFRREGWPVEIILEYDTWRKIRDSEGEEGWIHQGLLSSRRMALVTPWDSGQLQLRKTPDADARIVAHVESGALALIRSCNGTWCEISFPQASGWIQQSSLWGAYPNEIFAQ